MLWCLLCVSVLHTVSGKRLRYCSGVYANANLLFSFFCFRFHCFIFAKELIKIVNSHRVRSSYCSHPFDSFHFIQKNFFQFFNFFFFEKNKIFSVVLAFICNAKRKTKKRKQFCVRYGHISTAYSATK